MDSKVYFLKCFALVEPMLQKVFTTLLIPIAPICKYHDTLDNFGQDMDPFYF